MPPPIAPPLTRRFNVRVPLRDGVTLAADLVLPAERPAPAVVMRTPYGRGGDRATERADAFARAGYAAVWVDVRGRGDSDGKFDPYRNDGLDGIKVVTAPPPRVPLRPRFQPTKPVPLAKIGQSRTAAAGFSGFLIPEPRTLPIREHFCTVTLSNGLPKK